MCNHSHASHVITDSVKPCNGFGKYIKLNNDYVLENSDTKYYYIEHYYSKSTEEFVKKLNKGSAVNGQDEDFKLFRIFRYFTINKIDYDKFVYIFKNVNIKTEKNKWSFNLKIVITDEHVKQKEILLYDWEKASVE